MAPSRKHVFISKRSGTYDVYKVDVDGKNEEKVLSGTGSERPDAIALSIHPTKISLHLSLPVIIPATKMVLC